MAELDPNNIQYELDKPPKDGITSINFAPNSSRYLLVSSWDFSISLYDVLNNERIYYYMHECPVLSSTFLSDEHYCCSAGTDGNIVLKNITVGQKTSLELIGTQNMATKTVKFNQTHNLLLAGSWDSTVNAYDIRIPNFSDSNLVKSMTHNGKIFAMDCLGDDKLVAGTSEHEIYIWDLRYMSSPSVKRKSTLTSQIRDIKSFSYGAYGFVSSSAEGRVSVEYLDKNSNQMKDKFTFKCHIEKDSSGLETVNPVNAISFHHKFKTFATGGSDNFVNIWDPAVKKRIFQLPKYPVGVLGLAFGNDPTCSTNLAIACSYNYELEENPEQVPSDKIFVRNINDVDIRAK